MFRSLRRSLSRIAVGGLFLACASPSFALPVTLSAGQSAGFNFNFIGENPAPPYFSIFTQAFISDSAGSDQWTMTWFSDLDLQGTDVETLTGSGTTPPGVGGFFRGDIPDEAGIADGVFSVNVSAIQGSITLDSLASVGLNQAGVDTGFQLPLPIETTPNRVPEPTSGALVGLALLATAGALSRRRKAAE